MYNPPVTPDHILGQLQDFPPTSTLKWSFTIWVLLTGVMGTEWVATKIKRIINCGRRYSVFSWWLKLVPPWLVTETIACATCRRSSCNTRSPNPAPCFIHRHWAEHNDIRLQCEGHTQESHRDTIFVTFSRQRKSCAPVLCLCVVTAPLLAVLFFSTTSPPLFLLSVSAPPPSTSLGNQF